MRAGRRRSPDPLRRVSACRRLACSEMVGQVRLAREYVRLRRKRRARHRAGCSRRRAPHIKLLFLDDPRRADRWPGRASRSPRSAASRPRRDVRRR
jgi:hypothetical protein